MGDNSLGVQVKKPPKPPTNPTNPNTIREWIADGKYKQALDAAKDFHKSAESADSESLLLEAYAARIDALARNGMEQEAEALRSLVRERFPDFSRVSAGSDDPNSLGALAAMLSPLADPACSPEVRKELEQRIRGDIWDLAALAACPALPPEHPLRVAAAALDRAFTAVTSRNVTDEELALPEVSHRSPLAPWKLLVRAIADFHRGDDAKCRESASLIHPESAPARLAHALMRLASPSKNGLDVELTTAATQLISAFAGKVGPLKKALGSLQTAFDSEARQPELRKAIELAIKEGRKAAPDHLEEIKRFIYIRAMVEGYDEERVLAAMDGLAKLDTELFRLLARGFEDARDPNFFPDACMAWDSFLHGAFQDRLIERDSVEAATVYLHMAELLTRVAPEDLAEVQLEERANWDGPGAADIYYLEPDTLFAMGCLMDPHTEAFAKWMQWAAPKGRRKKGKAEAQRDAVRVANAWHAALPGDIEPLLVLMDKADERNAFKKALEYLEQAEAIDQVNTKVRSARLRLLTRAVLGHLKRGKPAFAAEKLQLLAEVPAAVQGDRALVLAALAWQIARDNGDSGEADRKLKEIEAVLGRDGVRVLANTVCNLLGERPAFVPDRSKRAPNPEFPKMLGTVATIGRDFGILDLWFTVPDLKDATAMIPKVEKSLSTVDLLALSRLGLDYSYEELTFAATKAGLGRSAETDPRFLVDRAECLPGGPERVEVCANAAAVLGREHQDASVVEDAMAVSMTPPGSSLRNMTLEQAQGVARKEKQAKAFPKYGDPGPDYGDLLELPCDCPACRRRRGEKVSAGQEARWMDQAEQELGLDGDEFEDELRQGFFERAPPGLPPEVVQAMYEVFVGGMRSGQTPTEVMAKLQAMVGDMQPEKPGAGRKGKRR